MTLTKRTVREAGHCNFCNANIGPRGMIDGEAAVYELCGTTIGVRFCTSCLWELRAKLAEVKEASDA